MSAKRMQILAALIVLLAAALRMVGLEHNPPGFWQDEASTGVDAYLLWTTGKDRSGAFLPLIAASFGDYPLALYRYLDAPIVGLFGLTVKNERMVAAIAGTLMVPLAGLVIHKTFGPRAALATMIAGAFNPQWVHFSRYGSEAILMPFTLTLGWALIAYGITGKKYLIWLGAVALGLSAHTYHAVKIFLPLWMIGFLIMYRHEIKALWQTERKHVVGPALLFSLVVLPSAYLALTPNGMSRGTWVLAWYHVKGWAVVRMILSNYLSYFDLGMLFAHGGPAAAQSIPGVGLWSLIELPLIIVGLFALRSSPHRGVAGFIAFWLVLGPFPGGLTHETHNVGRAIGWLPVPCLLSGIGMLGILEWAERSSSKWLRAGMSSLLALGWTMTGVGIFYLVFSLYPRITQRDFQFEVSDALRCAEKLRMNDEQIVVSPQFQASGIFGQFFFADLPPLPSGEPAWVLADPPQVLPGKIVAFPAHRQPPPTGGVEVCKITQNGQNEGAAFVYRAK